MNRKFSTDMLKLDCARETDRITGAIKTFVSRDCRRQGAVVALSGGIDSSVTAALCLRALGHERVLALSMPERDSSKDSLEMARLVADRLGITMLTENITGALEVLGCYRQQDAAIRCVVPNYGPDCKFKIVLPNLFDSDKYRVFSIVVQWLDGTQVRTRLTSESYLALVAATNFKQRVRMLKEYYHADRRNYVVVGTPNRVEHDQGFFVKLGDGAADIKPIAHLYKTQVYQLAEYLGVPAEIRSRPPTTDTYSLSQTQEEFYFSLPLAKLDACLYAVNHGFLPEDVCEDVQLTREQVERVFNDIKAKRVATHYLHMPPVILDSNRTADPG